jgi:hypothetical protein
MSSPVITGRSIFHAQLFLNLDRSRALLFERRKLLEQIDANAKSFRLAIDELRSDRHAVVTNLKMAELKLLVLFQEYNLLQARRKKTRWLSCPADLFFLTLTF